MWELLWTTLAISLGIQAAFFALAASLRTDKVTDLSYGLTFVTLAVLLLVRGESPAAPAIGLALAVVVWGARLAGYLFYRILHMGRDARFDGVRERFLSFLTFWTFQGLTVWVVMLPVILWFGRMDPRAARWTPWAAAGLVVWAAGLVIETVADAQKFRFKREPGNDARWTDVGLWRYSRHPNYFGELLCWWGLFVWVAPDLGPWAAAALIGPLTITGLLLYGTGIPTLEASAAKKWGRIPDYQAYRERTHLLVPWPSGRASRRG